MFFETGILDNEIPFVLTKKTKGKISGVGKRIIEYHTIILQCALYYNLMITEFTECRCITVLHYKIIMSLVQGTLSYITLLTCLVYGTMFYTTKSCVDNREQCFTLQYSYA